jgi:hypothetical protein
MIYLNQRNIKVIFLQIFSPPLYILQDLYICSPLGMQTVSCSIFQLLMWKGQSLFLTLVPIGSICHLILTILVFWVLGQIVLETALLTVKAKISLISFLANLT